MLGIRSSSLQAVEEHPAVIESKAALDEAIAICAQCEADEFRMKRALNALRDATDEEIEEARANLVPPHPGITIQSYFIWPPAEAARQEVAKARAAYAASRIEPLQQLHVAGLDLLAPLFNKLNEAIDRAVALRQDAEDTRDLLLDKGAEEGMLPPLPSALLPDGVLVAQWEGAKALLDARRQDVHAL